MVKGEHESYISKNFERPHYVPLNKKIIDTIGINIRDEAGDLGTFEHGKVIINITFQDTVFHLKMVSSLTRLDSIGYDNKPDNT